MKALRIHGFGTPDQAVLQEAILAPPVDAQVAVRIHAASINPLDLKMLAGHMQSVFPVALPAIQGQGGVRGAFAFSSTIHRCWTRSSNAWPRGNCRWCSTPSTRHTR